MCVYMNIYIFNQFINMFPCDVFIFTWTYLSMLKRYLFNIVTMHIVQPVSLRLIIL